MRNLKKILALVLALVMSLSLMATAGASSFPDVDAENPYATAIEVLDELKVFQGYKEDGTFRPTETLNRAQAAVLVYRIATGDVEDKYLDNYTYMQQSKFTDLDGYNWAKGYINYCQNAGIVVGTSATTFDPGAKVTGYQLLVMLLRTLGYGKAGEFADPKGWELQTATIAEREGITKNVTTGDFGAPAPRQMVAEILFRGLLTETVEYSALIPGGYTKSGETLGMREFGLEKVSGVVMANEWANLEGDSVAKADTTVMKIDDKNVTVNKATDLDAVGLTYNAYIANGEGSTKRALTLEKSDVNVVAFNEGAGMEVSKLAKDNSLNVGDAEYYLNYAENWSETAKSDWRIAYAIKESTVNSDPDWKAYIDEIYASANHTKDGHTASQRQAYENEDAAAKTNYWFVAIRPGSTITKIDLEIMKEIFYMADREGENVDGDGNNVRYYGFGEVYAGTSSTLDRSDVMSWPQFEEEFLDGQNTNEYEDVENGNSLRIVDNNGDGKAEYVLKVTYTQDKAIGERRDVLQFNKLVISKYEDNNLAMMDEIAVGDVINYTIIDGKLTVYKADMITDTIHNKNFKNVTVDATDEGETHGQSEIDVYTNMETNIMLMAEKTSYNIYFDEFGYIRSYELAQGTQYALLTEMYTTGTQNWNYINTTDWTAEVKIADGDIEELPVANTRGNAFISESAWTSRSHNYYSGNLNFLQPAIAHLGNPNSENSNWYWPGKTIGTAAAYSLPSNDWNRGVFQMDPNDPAANPATGYIGGQPAYGVFNYGPVSANYTNGANGNGPVESSFSFTNVAAFTSDGEEISLAPATRLAKNANGYQIYRVGADAAANPTVNIALGFHGTEQELKDEYKRLNPTATDTAINTWFSTYTGAGHYDGDGIYPVYAVDYVQLVAENVKGGMRHFTIANSYEANYNTTSNTYVNANSETVFYVVEPGRVTYYDSYEKLPTIKADDIRAAYAVATNTNANADGMDYWVGDVIVIETSTIDKSWDSISLAYANPYETSGATQYFNSLNSEWRTYQPDSDELAKIGLVPDDYGWTNATNLSGRTFYEVYGTDYENGELTAAIRAIVQDWNDHGIYAGTVRRTRSLTMGNGYIDVDTLGRDNLIYDDSFVKPIDVDYDYEVPFYRISNTAGGYSWDADLIDFATDWTDPSGIKVGDQIIWVTDKDGHVAFVVDLGSRTKAEMGGDAYTAPTWLLDARDFAGSVIGATITSTSSLYAKILSEQRAKVPVMANVNISANVGAGTTLTVALDGAKLGEAKNNTALPGTVTVPVSINSTSSAVDLKVTASKAGGGNEALTFVLGSVSGNWSLLSYTGDANNVYTLRLVNSQIAARTVTNDIILFTEEFFEELDELVTAIDTNGIGNGTTQVDLETAMAVQELLDEAKATLNDANYAAKKPDGTSASSEVTSKVGELTTAEGKVDAKVDEATVTVSFTGDNATVKVDGEVVTSYQTAKNSTVKFSVTAAEGYTLESVKNGETVLTADANGLYSVAVAEADVTITITANATGAVGGEITEANVVIATGAITAGSKLPTASVTTTPANGADVSIAWTKDGADVEANVDTEEGSYVGTITVTPKTGFTAAADIAYKLNGVAVANAAALTVTITVNAAGAGDTEITEADVTIATDAITAGEALPTVGVTTTPANGADVSIKWTKDGSEVSADATTEEGSYVGTITVTPKTGFVAADAITYKLNGSPVANAAALTVTITVNAADAGDTEITEADVTIATDAITAGEALPTVGVTTTPANGADVSIKWTKDGSEVSADATTEEGSYVGTITVTPKTGFVAADAITYKLNGSPVANAAALTVTITVNAANPS